MIRILQQLQYPEDGFTALWCSRYTNTIEIIKGFQDKWGSVFIEKLISNMFDNRIISRQTMFLWNTRDTVLDLVKINMDLYKALRKLDDTYSGEPKSFNELYENHSMKYLQ